MNIPRHPISVEFLKILLAWAKAMGAVNVPSYDTYKSGMEKMKQATGGSHQDHHYSSEGNVYYSNSISESIRQVRTISDATTVKH
jgi:hypothetical protein